MIIGSNIEATEREILDKGVTLETLTDSLTLPNPEYAAVARFGKGKFYRKIPTHICYLKKVDGYYIIPRYYFGEPEGEWGNKGRTLTSEHHIKLRDYQEEFFNNNALTISSTTGILMEAPCGHGKCHGKGTKILMYDGSIKNVEDIVVGDLLMGDDSTPRKVLSLARGKEELFKIHQKKGEDYVVNRSHILTLQYRPYGRGCDKSRFGEVVDLPLENYLKLPESVKRHYYGFCVPIDFGYPKLLSIDPYLLGAWLGDGDQAHTYFTCDHRDRQLISYYKQIAKQWGCKVSMSRQKDAPNGKRNNSNIYRIISEKGEVNPLLEQFKKLGVIGNKHIPNDYIVTTKENRLQLLAGLIDTDGSYSNYVLEITQKRKNLAEDIRRLCWSLGFRVRMIEKVIKGVSYWRLIISGNIHEIPTRLERKKIPARTINKDPYVNAISVESIGEGDYYGFTLDGNHRYCLVDSTVTHNTLMGVYLSYLRGVQTLIVVPTYYLAKQWKQRIEEFTTASCVVITSKDTEIPTDRDFTVIVADLFTCRVLPDELINNVGHVILDEAHRMGAETYLPILDELPARYRTALTATFRRADGVHRILKYHFGEHIKMTNRFPRPFVYGVKTSVVLQGVVTKNKPHSAFLEFMEEHYKGFYKLHETKSAIAYDSKENGKLKGILDALLKKKQITKKAYAEVRSCLKRGEEMAYATVESYINDHSARRKEVINIIEECMKAGRTVLFLSKRKDTLKSLYAYFEKYRPMLIVSETNVRSEEDEEYLQTKCPLIFGVNQLAKEGLDIDRLDTLIIHLPMADTEQAIGRISRLCDGKKQPVALYLVDKCPLTYATFSKAKKTFAINADYKGDITTTMVKDIL